MNDLQPWLDKASGYVVSAWPFVAPIVGSVFGSYFGARFQEQGKIDGINRKLNDVVEHQRRVTEATEEIKSSLGLDVWKRQKIRDERKEAYFKVIVVTSKLRGHYAVMAGQDALDKGNNEVRKQLLKEQEEMVETSTEFREAVTIGLVVAPSTGVVILNALLQSATLTSRDWKQTLETFMNAELRFRDFVRDDLGHREV